MTNTSYPGPAAATAVGSAESATWPVSAQLVNTLSHRDFDGFQHCLAENARLRALLPPRELEADGGATITGCFRTWFGGTDRLELLDATFGEIGPKHSVRWRYQLTTTTDPRSARVIEQQLYLSGGSKIEQIDLVCSGFQTCTLDAHSREQAGTAGVGR